MHLFLLRVRFSVEMRQISRKPLRKIRGSLDLEVGKLYNTSQFFVGSHP